MAVYMSNDVETIVNSVNLSDHVTSISFVENAAELTTSAMGTSNVTRIGGLKDGSCSIEFLQDFAASEVYITLAALLGTVVTVAVKPVDSSTAATNPAKSVSCLVTEIPFIDGAVGDLATVSVNWPFTGAVTTATS
jgi:hypothetical protein